MNFVIERLNMTLICIHESRFQPMTNRISSEMFQSLYFHFRISYRDGWTMWHWKWQKHTIDYKYHSGDSWSSVVNGYLYMVFGEWHTALMLNVVEKLCSSFQNDFCVENATKTGDDQKCLCKWKIFEHW